MFFGLPLITPLRPNYFLSGRDVRARSKCVDVEVLKSFHLLFRRSFPLLHFRQLHCLIEGVRDSLGFLPLRTTPELRVGCRLSVLYEVVITIAVCDIPKVPFREEGQPFQLTKSSG